MEGDAPFEPDRRRLHDLADLAGMRGAAEAWEAAEARGFPVGHDPRRSFGRWLPCGSCLGSGSVAAPLSWEPVYSRRCRSCVAGSMAKERAVAAPPSPLECASLASVAHLWPTAEELAREAVRRLWGAFADECRLEPCVATADTDRVVWRVVDPAGWAPALHFERNRRGAGSGTPYGFAYHLMSRDCAPEPEWFTVLRRASWRAATARRLAAPPSAARLELEHELERPLDPARDFGPEPAPDAPPRRAERPTVRAMVMWPDDVMERAASSRDPAVVRALAGLPPRHLAVPAESYFHVARLASARETISSAFEGGGERPNPFAPLGRLNGLGFALHGVSRLGIELACPRAFPEHPSWPRPAAP